MFDLLPFARRNDLSNYFDDFEKNFFGDYSPKMASLKTDIIDKGNAYVIEADVPGFKKEDISIDIDGQYLTIKAEKKEEKEKKEDNYICRERRCGSYTRSFDISNVKADEIAAEFDNGVLKLTLPKLEEEAPKTRRIEIK